jgi:hypothetical protein
MKETARVEFLQSTFSAVSSDFSTVSSDMVNALNEGAEAIRQFTRLLNQIYTDEINIGMAFGL